FEMPHSGEFPGVGCPVIPLVCTGISFVGKLVAYRLPALPSVIRTVDHLPEPATRLRCVDAIGIYGRTFHMIDFPASEVGSAYLPLFTLSVCCKDKATLTRSHQYPNLTHRPSPPPVPFLILGCKSSTLDVHSEPSLI